MVNVAIQSEQMARKFKFTAAQLGKVVVYTLNDTSDAMRDAIREAMPQVFNNPKAFVINGVRSSHAKLVGDEIQPASVFIIGTSAKTRIGVRGMQKVTPAHAMDAQVFGGTRTYKGSERALHKVMGNYSQWAPGQKAPLDAPLSSGGDMPGGYMRKVMSALQALTYEGSTSTSRIRGTAGLRPKTADRLISSMYDPKTLAQRGETRYNVKNGRERQLQGLRGARQETVEKLLSSKQANRLSNFFIGNSRGANDRRVVYQFDWKVVDRKVQNSRFGVEYSSTKHLAKVNLRPVLFLTKGQRYRERLDFDGINTKTFEAQFPVILERTAARWALKFNR